MEDPINVIGDLHGQYYDLVKILNLTNTVGPNNKLLFLGDYVDRGNFGVEILIFLMALKICYPTYVFMLRGNHETR